MGRYGQPMQKVGPEVPHDARDSREPPEHGSGIEVTVRWNPGRKAGFTVAPTMGRIWELGAMDCEGRSPDRSRLTPEKGVTSSKL